MKICTDILVLSLIPYRRTHNSIFLRTSENTSLMFFSSVQFSQSCLILCDPIDCSSPGLPVHHQLPEFTETHVHWIGDAIQPSHPLSEKPFSFHLQSFPASGSFQMSQFFPSGGQSIGASASTSVLSMNIQNWFPLGLTGLISLQFKGLSRVFSNTTVQKHQFFGAQPSLWSSSYISMWLLEKPYLCMDLCWQSNVSAF